MTFFRLTYCLAVCLWVDAGRYWCRAIVCMARRSFWRQAEKPVIECNGALCEWRLQKCVILQVFSPYPLLSYLTQLSPHSVRTFFMDVSYQLLMLATSSGKRLCIGLLSICLSRWSITGKQHQRAEAASILVAIWWTSIGQTCSFTNWLSIASKDRRKGHSSIYIFLMPESSN